MSAGRLTAQKPVQELASLASRLPREIAGWTAEAEDSIAGPERAPGLFGETAPALTGLGFQGVLIRSYSDGRGAAVAEAFLMSSPAEAWGVFSHFQAGEKVLAGQEACLSGGRLHFWKGRFFVRVRTAAGGELGRKVVLGIGLQVSAAIREEGRPPRLLQALPPEKLIAGSPVYFRSQAALNGRYYLADEGALLLDGSAEAVSAEYRAGWSRTLLVICKYDSAARAAAAFARLGRGLFPPGPEEGATSIEGPLDYGEHAAATVMGDFVIVVLLSPDSRTSEELASAALERIRGLS